MWTTIWTYVSNIVEHKVWKAYCWWQGFKIFWEHTYKTFNSCVKKQKEKEIQIWQMFWIHCDLKQNICESSYSYDALND